MRIEIPEIAVVALIGASSSGKTTFAKRHFKKTEVLSSDYFRGLVSDDEGNQAASDAAFDALYYVANKRLDMGLLTVIDATNVQKEAREKIRHLAREQNCHAVAIVFDMPESLMQERNQAREDRKLGSHVIKNHTNQLRRSIKRLEKEGFRYVYVLHSVEEANDVEIVRKPLWNNKKNETGPFDVIGDVHGCFDELCELLEKLGYQVDRSKWTASHEEGRKVIFLGDLCDRGDKNVDVLRLVMNMAKQGSAYCVVGNHDAKLLKRLKNGNVPLTYGLDKTIEQLSVEAPEFIEEVKAFLNSLVSHYVLDGGKLVVAHAGLKEKMQGRGSMRVRDFCLYGDTTGETDEYGLPVRLPWANDYRGRATVVYGHTPNREVLDINNTYCIDTGCVFGGRLTAFRYPEKETVQVEAAKEYYRPVKPLNGEESVYDDALNIDDVMGQKHLVTRLRKGIKIQAENSAAALEIMSRFATDPHWLVYLPPTMSPCETSRLEDYLEHPMEAFDYYKSRGVGMVVCEQKHMGSRGVVVLCKDAETANKRFHTADDEFGVIYTRTGRRFFEQKEVELEILTRLRDVLTKTNFWEDHQTDWVCIDAEIMPWSAKAKKLIQEQYACVGRAGRNALNSAVTLLKQGADLHEKDDSTIDLGQIAKLYEEREAALHLYTEAYRRYCWDVNGIEDYKIAPFHVLATENKVWNQENHITHMETIRKYMTGKDPIFMETNHIVIDVLKEGDVSKGIAWWEALTLAGGEGMVVKPYGFIARKGTELLQPAVKCRGKEYLRIIYGPEYTLQENILRLKKRSLSKKRNLALNEFALGMESLERFVRKEPLYRVHECVFGVLALESEPVDPRL